MAVRGRKKIKPTTTVFTTPQKMDKPPSTLKGARKVAKAAMASDRKGLGGGMSAADVQAYAHRGPGSR